MCLGKNRHETVADAYTAQTAHAKAFGETLAVYFCTFCRSWHIGHPGGEAPRTRSNFKELA